MSRYDLTVFECRAIEPPLPNKSRDVPRVDDRRVLNGIFWIQRSGSSWRDLPQHYGPPTICNNCFRRWTKAGIWDRLMDGITDAHCGEVRMIDGTSVRVHHLAATLKKATRYDKLADNFLAFVQLAPIRLWLRAYESPAKHALSEIAQSLWVWEV